MSGAILKFLVNKVDLLFFPLQGRLYSFHKYSGTRQTLAQCSLVHICDKYLHLSRKKSRIFPFCGDSQDPSHLVDFYDNLVWSCRNGYDYNHLDCIWSTTASSSSTGDIVFCSGSSELIVFASGNAFEPVRRDFVIHHQQLIIIQCNY